MLHHILFTRALRHKQNDFICVLSSCFRFNPWCHQHPHPMFHQATRQSTTTTRHIRLLVKISVSTQLTTMSDMIPRPYLARREQRTPAPFSQRDYDLIPLPLVPAVEPSLSRVDRLQRRLKSFSVVFFCRLIIAFVPPIARRHTSMKHKPRPDLSTWPRTEYSDHHTHLNTQHLFTNYNLHSNTAD